MVLNSNVSPENMTDTNDRTNLNKRLESTISQENNTKNIELNDVLELIESLEGFGKTVEWKKLHRIYETFEKGDSHKDVTKNQKLIQH